MFLASDNTGPVHPQIMQELLNANTGNVSSYGADAIMAEVRETLRTIFEAPDAVVHLVATGTAANVLTLSCLTNPWDTIFCTSMAHINCDECNAPEFYSGAKLTLVPSTKAKMTPAGLSSSIAGEGNRGVHGPQRGPVSITQVTERGTLYTLDEISALANVARQYGLPVHMDGARFANALVALNCTPAQMTWKAGIDAVSFGGTKNGCMGVEACIIFDPSHAQHFELRRKRGAHLFSKHRYLSAQMKGYLKDDLWLTLAQQANATAQRLVRGLRNDERINLLYDVSANMIFFRASRGLHQKLMAGGAVYYVEDGPVSIGDINAPLTGRLVTDWSMTEDAADRFLRLLRE